MDEKLNNIIKEVGSLYLKYGIKSVTMDDVARHLGISKKTLYTYVKDKNELVRLTVEAQIAEHETLYEQMDSANVKALDEVYTVFIKVGQVFQELNPSYQYDLHKYYPQLCKEFMGFKKKQLFNSIKANLLKGIKEGVYRKEINVDIIAHMQVSHHVMDENEDENPWFNKETFEEVFLYHMHAILNEKGREELLKKNFFKNN
jgi:AcrR family transcriptional regulator